MNLAHVTVNERSQTHKVTCYTILSENVWRQTSREKEQRRCCQRPGGRVGNWLLPGSQNWMQNHTNIGRVQLDTSPASSSSARAIPPQHLLNPQSLGLFRPHALGRGPKDAGRRPGQQGGRRWLFPPPPHQRGFKGKENVISARP